MDQSKIHTDSRKRLAWVAARSLRQVFFSGANDRTKLRLFRAVVESVFIYGLDAVPLTVSKLRYLDGSYRQLTRYAMGISFPDIISNDELNARTGLPAMSDIISRHQKDLVGHVLRMQTRLTTPLGQILLNYPTNALTRRGQSNTTTIYKNIFN